VSENAPLQDSFSERISSRWACIPSENSVLLSSVRRDNQSDEILMGCEHQLIRRDEAFRAGEQCGAERLAAGYFTAVPRLDWRMVI
jgi:hypothetical protein